MKAISSRLTNRMRVGALALAAGLGLAASAEAANNLGLDTLPLTIVNNSGLSTPMYVYIWAEYNSANYYVSAANGTMTKLTSTGGKFQPFGLSAGTAKTYTVQIPKLSAVRVYVSYGRQMQVNVGSNGSPSTPVGWAKSDPNLTTLFDWFEYTWVDGGNANLPPNSTNLNGNATQVDMLGLTMMLRLKGVDATNKPILTAAGFNTATARQNIMTALQKAPAPWRNLVIKGSGNVPVRAISPYNGMAYGTFPTNQLAGYINQVWHKYRKPLMRTTTNAGGVTGNFVGVVQGNNLVFSQPHTTGQTVTFAKPTSLMAYQAYPGTVPAGASATLKAQAAQIETYVQAALMRTTMLKNGNISSCPSPKTYYVNKPVNMYSKIIHQYAFKRQAYGFGYDDNCNQASDYTVFNPTGVQLTIQAVVPPKTKAKRS